MTGIEPVASSLPRKRSTPELHRPKIERGSRQRDDFALSERPGSNRRHSAWKADALPTELLSQFNLILNSNVGRAGFEPAKT